MKKRLLLGILPALMVLSACNGAGAKVEEPQLYLETTEANDVFGEAEFAGELRAKRNIGEEPEVDPYKVPVVGVQYKTMEGTGDNPDTYAIRYIAAISSLNIRAYWSRGLTTIADVPVKPLTSGRETKMAYSSLLQTNEKTGELESITPKQFAGEGYNYFVTYSMYNIPEAELTSYMIGYLTIGENSETPDSSKNVTSDAVVSQISSTGVCFTVSSTQVYFMGGTLNGQKNSVVNADSETWSYNDNNASFIYDFAANDTFCVFKHNPNDENATYRFEVIADSKLQDRDDEQFDADGYFGQVKVLNSYGYNLYISRDANKIYWGRTHQASEYYILGTAAKGWSTDEDYRLVLESPRNIAVIKNVYLNVGEFKIAKGDWSYEWGSYGYKNGGDTIYPGGNLIFGPAVTKGNISVGDGEGNPNIKCVVAAYYDFYICNSNYISIEIHA